MSKRRKLICRERQENGARRASGLIHSVASKGVNRRKGHLSALLGPGCSSGSSGCGFHEAVLHPVLNPLLLKQA